MKYTNSTLPETVNNPRPVRRNMSVPGLNANVKSDCGFSTVLIPGSAESKWDSNEADPFENVKMRREREVKGLLDKVGSTPSAFFS